MNPKRPLIGKTLNNFYIWKVIIFFYILFIISLVASMYLIKNTSNKIKHEYKEYTVKTVIKLNLLSEIRKNIFLAEDATLKHIFLTDNLAMIQEKNIIKNITSNQVSYIKYKQYISTNQEQKLYEELLLKRAENIKSREKIIYLSDQNKDREAVFLYNENYLQNFNDLSNIITTLINLQVEKSNIESNNSSKYINKSVEIIIFYISFSILIILIIGLLIYHNFKRMVKINNSIKYQKNLSDTLLDSGPDAIIGINENEEIISFNKQAETIYGYTRTEVLNKNYQFLLDKSFDNNFTKGIKKNGKEFPIEINKSDILNDGKLLTLYSIRDTSEKDKITQILKDNEEKFRSVFEGSPNAIVLSDGENYLDCNNQTLKMFGVKNVSDFLKHNPIDFSPEFQPNGERSEVLFKQLVKKTIELGHYRFEWQLKRLDGKLFFSEMLLSYYLYQGKKVIQANVIDISDQKKTNDFIEGINKAVSVKTGKNYFSELTSFLIEHLKVKYAFVGSYIQEIDSIETISFRDANLELDNFIYELKNTPCQKTLEEETFCCYPSNVQSLFPKDLDLEKMNVESYLGINLIYKGKIEGIIVLMDDKSMEDFEDKKKLLSIIIPRTINELKQRNIFHKLKESRELNKGILSSLTSHIAVIDDTGNIITVNKAWKLFSKQNNGDSSKINNKKYNYFEVCEKAAASGDAIANEILIGIKKILNKKLNYVSIEYPCHSPTEERWFEFSAMPFGKNANKIVITHRDISSEKKSDQIQEIQNLELIKTNSELDKFVYSISHDLRAPLTSMLGLIDLSYDCEIEERPELLSMMKQSVVKLDDLITDILIYSRNKNTLIINEEIDFKNSINATRNNHLYMEGTENILIDVTIDQKSPFVSDKIRITYILNNLYSNAIKYYDTNKNNSFLNISIHTDDTEAIITFEDNGIGIAEKDKIRIFEMFYRSTKLSTGSGLGLYILKESIEKMNGNIDLKSEIHKGSVFTISIPNLINQ